MNSDLPAPPVLQDVWGESPCSECPDTPCCRRAPLVSVSVSFRAGMDSLSALSQRSHLEVGLKDNGRWSVYYRAACRFLNPVDGKCRIFGRPDQSIVCKTYNAHRCGYKPAFTGTANSRMIRYNSRRLTELINLLTFRPDGEIETIPDWSELAEAAEKIPYLQYTSPASALSLPRLSTLSEIKNYGYLPFPPFGKPVTLNQCDLIRFRLGFPGTYLGLTDSTWFTLIPAPYDAEEKSGEKEQIFSFNPLIQPAEDNRKPDPLWPTDGLPSAFEDVLTVCYEDFPKFLSKLKIDDQGIITKIPNIRDLATIWGDDNPRTPLKSA